MPISTTLYNQKGQPQGKIQLDPRIFGAPIKPQPMAQAVRVRLQNARLGTRKSKARGEVAGGGRKPWRQKGTGRARHGSIRSPLWVGGGHAHALTSTDFTLKMPKKMRRQALFSALSSKFKQNQLVVVATIQLKEIKTQKLNQILQALPLKSQKTLVVIPAPEQKLQLSARNLPQAKTLEARLLDTYTVLNFESLLFLQDSLAVLQKTFLKNAD